MTRSYVKKHNTRISSLYLELENIHCSNHIYFSDIVLLLSAVKVISRQFHVSLVFCVIHSTLWPLAIIDLCFLFVRSWPCWTTCCICWTCSCIFWFSSLPICCLLWTFSLIFKFQGKCFWWLYFQQSLEQPISCKWDTHLLCFPLCGCPLSQLGTAVISLPYSKQPRSWSWSGLIAINDPKGSEEQFW